MKVKILNVKGAWKEIRNAALTTIHKEGRNTEPRDSWKRRMLLAEHSPIRKLIINWKWKDLLSWVSVHLVRHKYGIEHFVRTQRTDRTGINRNELKQGELIEHEAEANAQAIINISRKRLCSQASHETRNAWQEALKKIEKIEPQLASCCVPDCIYRGHCYEYHSCNWHKTEEFKNTLTVYRDGVN